MLSPMLERTVQLWPEISDVLLVPHTEAEYNKTVALLDELIDEVGEDVDHPLASLMETLGTLIEAYEDQHYLEPTGDPIASLQEFMRDHGLNNQDLPELGEASVVTEILSRQRELTRSQIQALAKRFNVSPAVFV